MFAAIYRFFEAELRISFGIDKDGKKASIKADVYQAKGRFNKDAPDTVMRSLLSAKKSLVGLSVYAFAASKVE